MRARDHFETQQPYSRGQGGGMSASRASLPFDTLRAGVPGAERDGREGDFWFVHMVLLEPYWNINNGV
jgi:hypothetical protein